MNSVSTKTINITATIIINQGFKVKGEKAKEEKVKGESIKVKV